MVRLYIVWSVLFIVSTKTVLSSPSKLTVINVYSGLKNIYNNKSHSDIKLPALPAVKTNKPPLEPRNKSKRNLITLSPKFETFPYNEKRRNPFPNSGNVNNQHQWVGKFNYQADEVRRKPLRVFNNKSPSWERNRNTSSELTSREEEDSAEFELEVEKINYPPKEFKKRPLRVAYKPNTLWGRKIPSEMPQEKESEEIELESDEDDNEDEEKENQSVEEDDEDEKEEDEEKSEEEDEEKKEKDSDISFEDPSPTDMNFKKNLNLQKYWNDMDKMQKVYKTYYNKYIPITNLYNQNRLTKEIEDNYKFELDHENDLFDRPKHLKPSYPTKSKRKARTKRRYS